MRVINIIVSDNECPVISIDSFGIVDEQLSNDVVQDAESFFIEKCVTLKFGKGSRLNIASDNFRDEIEEEIGNGYMTIGETTVSLATSYIENVQL